ncbi:MAG: hypothetical protein ACI9W2_001119 [Gammaproteobacteria bacterium]|jgi:hypothetical protein
MIKIARLAAIVLIVTSSPASAVLLAIQNASFEDDAPTSNEFFFGTPQGWTLHDPNNLIQLSNNVVGSLVTAGSTEYFAAGEATGDHVGIIFIGASEGGGEVGLGQVLSDTLAANTRYSFSVDVGNIQSGFTTTNQFFNLDGFPGYRIELRAGNALLAQTSDGISAPIAQGTFETITVEHTTGATPLEEGQALEIRLFSLNLIDNAFPLADSEVDFDNVRLDASPVPLPTSVLLLGGALLPLLWRRLQRQTS